MLLVGYKTGFVNSGFQPQSLWQTRQLVPSGAAEQDSSLTKRCKPLIKGAVLLGQSLEQALLVLSHRERVYKLKPTNSQVLPRDRGILCQHDKSVGAFSKVGLQSRQ